MFFLRYFTLSGFQGVYQSLGFDLEQKSAVKSEADANNYALQQFLSGVEKRAYRIAQIATNNSDDAFDIVQDAMFKLVEKYSNKPRDEWGPLFHRILQSRIRDWYRRSKVRNRFRVWFSSSNDDAEQEDPIQTAKDNAGQSPEEALLTNNNMELLESALRNLPFRQQQAFLLRAWEELSVKQTAQAMNCSQGSVKTHYSRAKKALQAQLTDQQGGQLR